VDVEQRDIRPPIAADRRTKGLFGGVVRADAAKARRPVDQQPQTFARLPIIFDDGNS
jgi:hypothetical protein